MSDKGFSVNLGSEQKNQPVTPVFKAPHLTFEEKAEEFNNTLILGEQIKAQESHATRFVAYSVALHAILVFGMLTISTQESKPVMETVEIEMISDGAEMTAGLNVPETLGAASEAAPAVAAQPATAATPAPAPAALVKAAPVSTAQPLTAVSDIEVPASIDELEAPKLNEEQFEAKAVVVPVVTSKDLAQQAEDLKQKNAEQEEALRNEMKAVTEDKSALDAIEELDRKNAAEAALLAKKAEELKQKNAQALAAAQAREAAARAKADQDLADRAAAARSASEAKFAAATAAAAASVGNGGSGSKADGRIDEATNEGKQGLAGSGDGGGAKGDNIASASHGSPTSVRNLEQLRQMPGNPRPQYSEAERLNRQQGEAIYVAYISKAGTPTDFRQLKGTGFENLDAKTLAALKKWRFQPGQEGWVEIPFRWDILGGAQESSARRKDSAPKRASSALRTQTN